MKKRRFVPSRFEDACKTIGTALIVAGLIGLIFEPSDTPVNSGISLAAGILTLLYGLTEVDNG